MKSMAPAGTLRAVINLGNPILARQDKASGELLGVSVDLARALADELAVPLMLMPVDSAAQSVQAVTQGNADIGFFAIDPVRGQGIAFTPPYVLIEGSYLVRTDSPLTDNAQVDQSSHRVVVGHVATDARRTAGPADQGRVGAGISRLQDASRAGCRRATSWPAC